MGNFLAQSAEYIENIDIARLSGYTVEEVENQRLLFKKRYKTGYITRRLFMHDYSKDMNSRIRDGGKLAAARFFSVLNTNGDDKIDFREFMLGMSQIRDLKLNDRERWSFRIYDINDDGYVSLDEMCAVFRSIQTTLNDTRDVLNDTQIHTRYNSFPRKGEQLTVEEFVNGSKKMPIFADLVCQHWEERIPI